MSFVFCLKDGIEGRLREKAIEVHTHIVPMYVIRGKLPCIRSGIWTRYLTISSALSISSSQGSFSPLLIIKYSIHHLYTAINDKFLTSKKWRGNAHLSECRITSEYSAFSVLAALLDTSHVFSCMICRSWRKKGWRQTAESWPSALSPQPNGAAA